MSKFIKFAFTIVWTLRFLEQQEKMKDLQCEMWMQVQLIMD